MVGFLAPAMDETACLIAAWLPRDSSQVVASPTIPTSRLEG